MPRLAIFNMMFGFLILSLAAAAGAFIATDISDGFLRDPAILDSWLLLLQRSAHGHTNLFGILHVVLGLTMPYSVLSPRSKLWQTIGLGLGSAAMGPGLMVRAYLGPAEGVDFTSAALGLMLSAALLALASHAFGLAGRILGRA